jgi:hypothetical protein
MAALSPAFAAVTPTPPVFTFTIDSEYAFNTAVQTANNTSSSYLRNYYSSSPVTYVETTHSEVKTPATGTTPGLAWDYIDTTASQTHTVETYQTDTGSTTILADGTQPVNFSGNKYIQITGHISATQATTLSMSLSAYGNYLTTTTPFGSAAPALPSFYFSDTPAPVSIRPVNTDAGNGDYSASSYADGISLAANDTVYFKAVVFAGNDVSLSSFSMGFSTGQYDHLINTKVTPESSVSSRLVGAHIIPVPEPETYGMLLVGLMLIGGLSKRNKRSERFS